MFYLKSFLALVCGFIVIYLGSVIAPGIILPMLYGPYPVEGNVPLVRLVTDFSISFFFTMLGGYIAAALSPSKPVFFGLAAGFMYFALSAFLYSGYGLSGGEWLTPIIMLIKVPIAAYLGAMLCKNT